METQTENSCNLKIHDRIKKLGNAKNRIRCNKVEKVKKEDYIIEKTKVK